MSRGRFLTFEGIDGAGKSTHVQWLAEELQGQGIDVLQTREPGGTRLGEALRAIVLSEPMGPHTEALLMFASRQEHIGQVIEPALSAGQWVLCDRFTDASFAYQGGGRRLPKQVLERLESSLQPSLTPDMTVFFDTPVATAKARLETSRHLDRFERLDDAFFSRVRDAYLQRMSEDSERFVHIDGSQVPQNVRDQIRDRVLPRCMNFSKPAKNLP